ncbi:phosphoglycerate kinase [Candidatus Peregrinibacteria bacterium]|nr:MAG: phosphoglycerate kinase [Candidatus Peregrinibacteria bacterium]
MKTLKDLPAIEGKNVIVRVDFNVPVDENGSIKDDKRIRIALPTLKELLSKKPAQIILMTHMGRPKDGEKPARLSTGQVAAHLSQLLGMPVKKIDDWGEHGMPDAAIVMLENLRFHPGEKVKTKLNVMRLPSSLPI